eukprot:8496734-Pyramimonas_sp.AAC.1
MSNSVGGLILERSMLPKNFWTYTCAAAESVSFAEKTSPQCEASPASIWLGSVVTDPSGRARPARPNLRPHGSQSFPRRSRPLSFLASLALTRAG